MAKKKKKTKPKKKAEKADYDWDNFIRDVKKYIMEAESLKKKIRRSNG